MELTDKVISELVQNINGLIQGAKTELPEIALEIIKLGIGDGVIYLTWYLSLFLISLVAMKMLYSKIRNLINSDMDGEEKAIKSAGLGLVFFFVSLLFLNSGDRVCLNATEIYETQVAPKMFVLKKLSKLTKQINGRE
jgi:hypothetical protein